MLDGALGDTYAFSETLVKMTPLLLTGLAVAIAFRMQLWNIGAEGQLHLGARSVLLSCRSLPAVRTPGAWVMIPAMLIAGADRRRALGSGAGRPARESSNANETITTPDAQLRRRSLHASTWSTVPGAIPQAFGFPGTQGLFPDAAALPHYQTFSRPSRPRLRPVSRRSSC